MTHSTCERVLIRQLLMTMSVALIVPLTAFSDTQTVDGVEWLFTIKDGEAQVGDGRKGALGRAVSPSTTGVLSVPSTLGGCPVTRIGANAFFECDGVETVKIPASVTDIGRDAFACCGLKSFDVDDANAKYSSRDGLLCSKDGATLLVGVNGSVIIPSSVTNIDGDAFAYCFDLQSVTIPSGVKKIEEWSFCDCSNLVSVTILPGVESIGECAFHSCSGLTSIVIPESVTNIGRSAFFHCVGLSTAKIPPGVTKIGECAFDGCRGLKSVEVPSRAIDIQCQAFRDCDALEMLVISKGVEKLGCEAFSGCNSLESVIISEGVTNIAGGAFSSCRALKTVTMPQSVVSIGNCAFFECRELESVTLPEGLISIGDLAFYKCSGLKAITIPPRVEVIGEAAFSGCTGLKSMAIPSSVKVIVKEAFNMCGGVKSFEVDVKNTAYRSMNGMLCSKDGRVLIRAVNGEVLIPANMTKIESSALEGCDGLKSFRVDEANPIFRSIDGLLCSKDGSMLLSGVCGDVIIHPTITAVGCMAFRDNDGLKSIEIPASVTNICTWAFMGCGELKSFKVADANPRYRSINGLLCTKDGRMLLSGINGDVVIPTNVAEIVGNAFSGRDGLKSISIPSSVRKIGGAAFEPCRGLTFVRILSNLEGVAPSAFLHCPNIKSVEIVHDGQIVTIPYANTSRCHSGEWTYDVVLGVVFLGGEGRNAVSKNRLGELVIPDVIDGKPVYGIREGAFSGCKIKSVTISHGMTSIAYGAFRDCRNLESMTIPSTVTNINARAFMECPKLKVVNIMQDGKVDSVSFDEFCKRWHLSRPSESLGLQRPTVTSPGVSRLAPSRQSRSVTQTVTTNGVKWTYTVVDGAIFLWGNDGRLWRRAVPKNTSGDLYIPSAFDGVPVVSVGNRAFAGLTNLTSVTIPQSITNIGWGAFWGCVNLTTVTIPLPLTNVHYTAFDNCPKLKSVEVAREGKSEVLSFEDFRRQWKLSRPNLRRRPGNQLRKRSNTHPTAAEQRMNGIANKIKFRTQTEEEKFQLEAEREAQRRELIAIREKLKWNREAKDSERSK